MRAGNGHGESGRQKPAARQGIATQNDFSAMAGIIRYARLAVNGLSVR
ncbi:hypothetical protein [Devosia sp. DBB001]|nr:hypothetical protein [Devosia sp. DBB001]